MKLDMTLPFDEPTDTMQGRAFRRSRGTTRPLNEEDEARMRPSPKSPRGLKDIPEQFRKPSAPPGVKR